ncbi:Agamous-like MADS-box protein AGL61 [Heracleum sosnowskyi]|uniref:Agamous-like MADS-box protein AGL61 n=1 Tax=Heracleum sosnowskyi TaxID=360622 RepID=A0AAD8H8A8_9APIA|nr:Agamous-like MADS-box protein AGL61 [Heracleum sosnowskyi]
MARKGVARQRIAIKKIENESNLKVTFSKRRSGVYKKASELSILCNCHVAIIIISATGKIYSFGHPSPEQVLYSFVSENHQQESMEQHLMENLQDFEFYELNKEMGEYEAIIATEKTREKKNNEPSSDSRKENCLEKWWLTPPEQLTLVESQEMLAKLEELKQSINSSGMKVDTSSSWRINEASHVVPHLGGFPPISDPNLASTSFGFGHNSKGKAPM